MSKAEEFILKNTNVNSSDIIDWYDNGLPVYKHWLTPDQAKEAVEIARGELIDRAVEWIGEIYNHHEIMRYSDSCEPPLSELTEWFKNYMKEG